jgi:hypothetical protein
MKLWVLFSQDPRMTTTQLTCGDVMEALRVRVSGNYIRDGHSAVGNNFYNLEPWIFSVMLMEICSQLQFPLTK